MPEALNETIRKNASALASVLTSLLDDAATYTANRVVNGGSSTEPPPPDLKQLREGIGMGLVDPHQVEPSLRNATQEATEGLDPQSAEAVRGRLEPQLDLMKPELQRQAFRSRASVEAGVPSNPLSAAGRLTFGLGIGHLINHAINPLERWHDPATPKPSWGRTAKNMYGPVGLGVTAALDAVRSLVHARHDPRVAAGTSGMLGSAAESVAGEADAVDKANASDQSRFGVLGSVPGAAMRTLSHPLASVHALGRAIKARLTGGEAKEAADRAFDAIYWELNRRG